MRFVLLIMFAVSALVGCEKPVHPDDLPVSNWLSDSDPCVRASAAAIIQSGRPYPNRVIGPDGKHIKTVDMWVGGTLFVLPAEVSNTMGYPEHHPSRFHGLMGALPNFYPKGPSAEATQGIGPSVFVQFACSMDKKYADSWGKGYKSNDEGMAKVKRRYEKIILADHPPVVTINRREDIGMMEVLKDTGLRSDGTRAYEASYWPINGELKSPDGSVSGISCIERHDPHRKDYSIDRCTASMRLTRNVKADVIIYVPYVQYMPTVYDQVKTVLLKAMQEGAQ